MAGLNFFGYSLHSLLRNPRIRQAGVLYAALVSSLVLGIAVSVINTRLLGPKAFGDFKLLQTVWAVGVLFATFGLLTTGGNLLAEKKSRDAEKPLLGSLLVLSAFLSLVFIVIMAAASFPLEQLYGEEFGHKVRLYAGLLFVFPLQIYLQEALRGTNDIYNLAFLNALPQFAYIPAALAVHYLYGFSLDLAILLYLLSLALTVLMIIYWIKPTFSSVGRGIQEVLSKNLAIGFHIYIATLVTTSTAYLGQFTLGFFQDTTKVGEFALALTITMPLTMVPNAIATTYFKQFTNANRIPTKVLALAAGLSAVTLAGFFLVIKAVILFLFTERFRDVIPLAYVCAVGCVIHGMGDVFNRFLLAHGKTSLLRSNAMHLGMISTLGYFVLVAWNGAMGAALTKLLVAIVYLVAMLIYYQFINKKYTTGVTG